MLAEYVAMVLVYFAVLFGTRLIFNNGQQVVAIIAMIATLFIARAIRPRNDQLPPSRPPGA